MSYALRRSSSSCSVVVRWTHLCLTAPSRCSGHPPGIRESSSSPSPFCSLTVPNNLCVADCFATFQLAGVRALQPLLVLQILGCSRRGRASSLMMSRSPCIGSRGVAEPSAAALATVSSSNHVGRRDFTPIALWESATLMACMFQIGCKS